MVFFDNDRVFSSTENESSENDDHVISTEDVNQSASVSSSLNSASGSSSCSITGQTHLVVEVRGRGHGHQTRVDLHSVSSLSRDVEIGARTQSTVSSSIPRSVASIRSLFDLAESSASSYNHGGEIGGRSSVLALQVPASSLPPPFSASAMIDSFRISTPPTFFPALPTQSQSLLDAGPSGLSTSEGRSCMPCQTSENSELSSIGATNLRIHTSTPPSSCSASQGEIALRLTEVLQGRGDEVALRCAGSRDNIMLQWLQALDVHVVGACRADERLRPILQWNMSCSDADGCLIAHLSQHFKARELGLLARCLCAPLVSLRVGKIQREGRILCPLTRRGYLSLTMLPSSEMRLSFVGDDGVVERIASVKSSGERMPLDIAMLAPDSSGRSFALKLPGSEQFFWQSERSKMVGDQLIAEMKDLLSRRLSLSQLTGVHQSRLGSFMNQLRGVLHATSLDPQSCSSSSVTQPSNGSEINYSTPTGLRQSRRVSGNKSIVRPLNGGQSSLSRHASGFKDAGSRAAINSRSVISSKEKYRRCLDTPLSSSAFYSSFCTSSVNQKPQDSGGIWVPPTDLNGLLHSNDIVTAAQPKQMVSAPMVSPSFTPATNLLPTFLGSSSLSQSNLYPPVPPHLQIPTSTFFAPYYCPCPLGSSALQYAITPPFLPPLSEISTVTSSPFFSVKPSASILSQTSISLDRVNISPIPLPVTSLVNIPTPLQIPSFFSDPIVHIPVIDFQSANQGFVLNTSPAISSCGVPPVLPSFVSSILPTGECSGDGQDLPPLSIFKGLEIGACKSDMAAADLQPLLVDSRFRALLANCSMDRSSNNSMVDQPNDVSWYTRCENSRSPALDTIPQYSGPLLGMVPAIFTSGSVSCVLNFCEERASQTTAWVSGSRGLYGGSCEPGSPSPSNSPSIGVAIRGTDIFEMPNSKPILIEASDHGCLNKASEGSKDKSLEDDPKGRQS